MIKTNCQAILKTGNNKGKVCKNTARWKLDSKVYCGVHCRSKNRVSLGNKTKSCKKNMKIMINGFDYKKQLFQLEDHFKKDVIDEFNKFILGCKWYQGIPGGFLTNTPQRLVTTFGDGSPISNEGKTYGEGWKETHWTAKTNASNVTLTTKTEPMPDIFAAMVPTVRKLYSKCYPSAKITHNTFNIAVCNYYTNYDDYIAAHTDCNKWYPVEDDVGPVFASFTLYPKGFNGKYARFQINVGDGWKQVDLSHNSILIMPSNINHRLKAFTKTQKDKFSPRINITFRSTYPRKVNPLMNFMAVANHTRYYRIPHKLTFPKNFLKDRKAVIIAAYDKVAEKYGRDKLQIKERCAEDTKKDKKILTDKYKEKYGKFRVGSNMVLETFQQLN